MKQQHRNLKFTKASEFVEIEASRDDTYIEFCSKSERALKMTVPESYKEVLTLFRLNGTVVLDQKLLVDGSDVDRDWTLGNYLTKIKKSPNNVKFGVGYRVEVSINKSVQIILIYNNRTVMKVIVKLVMDIYVVVTR